MASLRGEVVLGELSPAVREMLAITGWKPGAEPATGAGRVVDLRQSSWHLPAVSASAGNYQTTAVAPDGRGFAGGAVDVSPLFSHRLPLEEGPRGYALFEEKRERCTKVLLVP